MYKEHYTFHTPQKESTIWRYIDFTKLVDLLVTNQLFFNRSDNFDDPFEGSFKLKDYEETKEILSTQQEIRKYYFLNCWHISDDQSDAMWKCLSTKNGIAIKSSVDKLIKSLEVATEDVFIGRIYYRDFTKVTFNELLFEEQNKTFGGRGGSLNQFNYKRINFEHEKELRLYYVDLPIPQVIKNGIPREPLTQKRININPSALIDEIIVAPFAEHWFRDLVEKFTARLNYQFKVSKSDLYNYDK
jgi:hypothetical protein